MKASDTVMPEENLIILSYMNPELIEKMLGEILQKQADVSFKAGVKEVVDWLNKNSEKEAVGKNSDDDVIVILEKDWIDKIKEWEMNK